jgi:hypothetical protein
VLRVAFVRLPDTTVQLDTLRQLDGSVSAGAAEMWCRPNTR